MMNQKYFTRTNERLPVTLPCTEGMRLFKSFKPQLALTLLHREAYLSLDINIYRVNTLLKQI